MNRRATYMYGALLPRGPTGHVDAGSARRYRWRGEPRRPDGKHLRDRRPTRRRWVEIIFQVTPDTEAPAEMNFFFRNLALCAWLKTARATCTISTPSRRPGSRRQGLELLHRRGSRAVRRGHQGPVRQPSLAALGKRQGRGVPQEAARSLQVHSRPDPAPGQPRPHCLGNRRGARLASKPRVRMVHAGYYGTLSHNAKASISDI